MTKKELQELEAGTLLFNGHHEGVIRMDGKEKVIEILIPISGMSNDSTHLEEQPIHWSAMEW